MLKIGSLFSGYGGLDLAVSESFGAEVVWHCEWEDAPATVLEAHWPDAPNYRDVSKVDWSSVEPVDILTGGFPCQDVSQAGRRAGLRLGTRSGLWSEFAKAIDVLRPSYVVIENVRGLLSAQADSDVEYCPWCMGETDGGGLLCEHLEPFSETWPTSGTMRNGLAYELPTPELPITDTGYLSSPIKRGGGVSVPTPTVSDSWTDGYERSITKQSPNRGVGLPTWANRIKLLRTPTAAEVEEGATLPAKARAEGRTVRLAAQALDKENWGDFSEAIRRWETILGRHAPEPTLPDGKKGQDRLSSKFTEWLMGLPEGWITGHGLNRKDEIKMAGNGVVPQQAKLALDILRERLNELDS